MKHKGLMGFAYICLVLGSLLALVLLVRGGGPPAAKLTSLSFDRSLARSRRFPSGSFWIDWQVKGGKATLLVRHQAEPKRIIWQSVPGKGFVAAGRGKAEIHERRGSFFIRERLLDRCTRQRISSLVSRRGLLWIRGHLLCDKRKKLLAYQLRFRPASDWRLHFDLTVRDPKYNRTYLRYASRPDEGFFGFGEQFTYFNMKGRRLPIFVMEQGIGRGAQPITAGANLTAGAGGDWHTSYAGVPHYMTSTMRSLFLTTSAYSVFDLRARHHVEVSLFASTMSGQLVFGRSPLELIQAYTAYAGRMRALPDWVHRGAIIGMQGGTVKVKKVLERLRARRAPVAAFWLQDWVGQRKTSFGKQLWWNWVLDQKHYPGWSAMRSDMEKDGIRLLLYINPFLADVKERKHKTRNLFQEAKDQGLLVLNGAKQPYMIRNTSFSAALLDLSNPRTVAWIQKVIHKEMIDIGASGWMADFAEALPADARLFSGEDAALAHNRYPEQWAKVNRDAIKDVKDHQNFVFFMRAGYTRSPQYNTLFWLGDQMVSWDRYDGIKTAVTGLLTSGLSGFSLNHSDIGGYTSITHPIQNYHRSAELHMRWAELSAFNTVFRTHEGNLPDKNHQFHSAPKTFSHFVRMAHIYKAWAFYRKQLVAQAAKKGWPVVRHPFVHYPREKAFYRMDYQQFMIGPHWLLVPVLNPGQRDVQVLLPKGKWVHLWSQRTYGNTNQLTHLTIPAPLGQPALFYKQGTPEGPRFLSNLRNANILPK